MGDLNQIELGFVIDKLTNSIINTISGDSFQTEVSVLTKTDLKSITKKEGWNFNWKSEFQDIQKEVYKLTIINNPNIIQGLLSISIFEDHIYMNLLESAPFNIGKTKLIKHYEETLGAYHFKNQRMIIETEPARSLVKKYFKD